MKFLRGIVRHCISIVAPISLLAFYADTAQSQPPSPTTGPQRQEQQGRAPIQTGLGATTNSSTVTTAAPSIAEGNDSKGKVGADDKDQRPPQKDGPDWTAIIQAIAASVSTGFTIAIWRVYKGQWKVMDTQAGLMTSALTETRNTIAKMDEIAAAQRADTLKIIAVSEAAAEAAKSSADAAIKTARTATADMMLRLRARLGVKTFAAHGFDDGQELFFVLVLQNFGGKGAGVEEFCFGTTILPLPVTPVYDSLQWHPVGSPVEADAQHELFVPYKTGMTKDQWAAIRDEHGPTRFRAYGAVRYDAGFGKIVMMRFCREFDPLTTRLKKSSVPVFTTAGAKAYNKAD